MKVVVRWHSRLTGGPVMLRADQVPSGGWHLRAMGNGRRAEARADDEEDGAVLLCCMLEELKGEPVRS